MSLINSCGKEPSFMPVMKRSRIWAAALSVMMLLSLFLPLTAAGEAAPEAGRWETEADMIDNYCDSAFAYYLEGKNTEAVGAVNNAYFKVYDIRFEMEVMNRISGPRKNKTELEFSTCKGLLKKDSSDEENRKAVRSELNTLKAMIREDCNKLSAMDGYRLSEVSYWLNGERVNNDPYAEYGGNAGAQRQYASWAEAAAAMDDLFETAREAYETFQESTALDSIKTAYYSVFEESGLSHKIYTDLGLTEREEVEEAFDKLQAAAIAESHKTRTFTRAIDNVKKTAKAKAASIDAKEAEAKAAEAAARQAEAAAEAAQSNPQWGTFVAAFGIIIREGLEAILVIAAIIAYLVKSGNSRSLRNVYIGALAGIVASFVAAGILYFVKKAFVGAGQSQEIIEGVTALIAVCVLFYVSNWMISKAEAASWSRYIDDKVQSSVERGSSFALAFTAFLSVFREGAEVVLFYQPMLTQGNAGMVWAGFGVGCVVLVFVYLAITKLSIKLPIKAFFTATSILMAIMCVSFLGSGIKELAEGGVFDTVLRVPGIPENDVIQIFGIYPFLETLVPQLILAIILLVTFLVAHYRGKIDALKAQYASKSPKTQKAKA